MTQPRPIFVASMTLCVVACASEPAENATDQSALTALEELSQPLQPLDEREREYLERHKEEQRRQRELRHTLERDPWPIRVPVDPWQEDLPVPEED